MTDRNPPVPEPALFSKLRIQASVLGGFLALLWLVQLINHFGFQDGLSLYGVFPRTAIGLRGIALMPFLHGSFGHLFANTIPLLILGWFVMLRGIGSFFAVSLLVTLLSGLGVWLFGSSALHIGASGLIFGYIGFLIARGYFERSLETIALSLIILVLFGSSFLGLLPNQPGISWEGHLFGLVGGIAAAWLLPAKDPGTAKANSDQPVI